MKNLTLSIMPSYKCNFKCEYCYLGDLIKTYKSLDLSVMNDLLLELKQQYTINHVNLYGGELSLLDQNYLQQLINIIKDNINNCGISITSNFSNENILTFCLSNNIQLNVSLNEERYNYLQTLNKIKKFSGTKLFDLAVVVLPSILNYSIPDLYKFYNELEFDVFFIQHHNSIHQQTYSISIDQFSNFLYDFICYHTNQKQNKFKIENLEILNDEDYNPNTESYLFINPDGKYCTTSFKNRIEEYILFDNLQQWQQYCETSRQLYIDKCSTCELFDKCKAEHLEILKNKDECSGLKQLLTSLKKRSILK